MSKWIYVEDRLPEQNQLVIVAVGNRNHFEKGAYKWRNPKNRFCDFFIPSYKDVGVFAWMPLPEFPIASKI